MTWNCVEIGLSNGSITEDQARIANDLYAQLEMELQASMSPEAAAAAAARGAFDELKANAAHTRRVELLQAQRWKRLQIDLNGYRTHKGKERPGEALGALIENRQNWRHSDLVYREDSVRKFAMSRMISILGRFRRGMFGQTRNKAELPELVRAIFGAENVSAAAREMAEAWKSASSYLRMRANAAGMRIANLEDWGLPQTHDANVVRKFGQSEWVQFILDNDLLDLSKMKSEQTGLTFNKNTIVQTLHDVWHNIAYEGIPGRVQPRAGQGKALHNRHTDHRFLVFKDADTWLKYQNQFGDPDPFHTMTNYVARMSRDIAELEILGPNPTAMMQGLKDAAKKRAIDLERAGSKGAIKTAKEDMKGFDDLYHFWKNPREIGNETFATIGQHVRNIQGSAMLGSAVLSAVADLNSQRMTSKMIGMPITRVITRVLGGLMTLNQEERYMASARMGIIAESWSRTAYNQARLFGEESGESFTARIADTTHKFSGLNRWTMANREAMGHEFMGFLADMSGTKFNDLSQATKNTFKRASISEAEWDVIRKTTLHEKDGGKFLNPIDIEAREGLAPGLGRQLADKVMEMIAREVDMGTPTASLRSRALWKAGQKAGTPMGELASSVGMFKSFPVTIVGRNLGRYIYDTTVGDRFNRGKIVASFIIGATVMGALAIQAKQISRGRDPRPMDEVRFWGAAFLQGGSLGIFGDFLFSDVSRSGGSFGKNLAGPVAQFTGELVDLTIGNIFEVAGGKDTEFGHEMVDFIGSYHPGSSIWYLRAAYERAVIDQLALMVDPKAGKRLSRKMKRYEKAYGAGHWWKRGELTPERAPDFANVVGE